ncbi:MAG: radical SAM protein [Methanomassiliicoccales archaeon]
MALKKVALVNMGFEKGEPGIIVSPPLGIMSIGAYLQQAGLEVKIFDWSSFPIDESIRSSLASFSPDIVGFTVIMGSCLLRTKKASALAKELGCRVVWGGPFPSAMSEMCLRQAPVDVVVVGEGELTMLELIRAWSEGRELEQVPGLAFLRSGEYVRTAPRERIRDLDSLPMPCWECILPLDRFLIPYHGRLAIPMVTSRGCPGTCSFCYTKNMWGYRWTSRSATKVVEEIQHLMSLEPRVGAIIFDDDLFAGDVKRIKEFCRLLRERNIDILWNCEIRARDVSQDLVREMKEAGCVELLIGVETGSDRLLSTVLKGVKKEDIIRAFEITHAAGLKGNAMLMVGLPGETMEDFEQTEAMLRKLEADGFYFSMFLPTPGTEYLEVAKQFGFKEPTTLEGWATLGGYGISSYPQRSLSQVPWERVERMIKRETRRARHRANLQAIRRDPLGAMARGLMGKAGKPDKS